MEELRRLACVDLKAIYHAFTKFIVSSNVRSLSQHFQDIHSTPNIKAADALCLQETWLDTDPRDHFEIYGFEKHSNSVGRGKGIITYFKSNFQFMCDKKNDTYQMTKICSDKEDVINIYRSVNTDSNKFINDLEDMFDSSKKTFIVGDLNICAITEKNHPVLFRIAQLGFLQKVEYPTHIEGRQIDHVFFFLPPLSQDSLCVKVVQQSSFFSDHDILFIVKVKHIVILLLQYFNILFIEKR